MRTELIVTPQHPNQLPTITQHDQHLFWKPKEVSIGRASWACEPRVSLSTNETSEPDDVNGMRASMVVLRLAKGAQ